MQFYTLKELIAYKTQINQHENYVLLAKVQHKFEHKTWELIGHGIKSDIYSQLGSVFGRLARRELRWKSHNFHKFLTYVQVTLGSAKMLNDPIPQFANGFPIIIQPYQLPRKAAEYLQRLDGKEGFKIHGYSVSLINPTIPMLMNALAFTNLFLDSIQATTLISENCNLQLDYPDLLSRMILTTLRHQNPEFAKNLCTYYELPVNEYF